jgi:hypothetical protein
MLEAELADTFRLFRAFWSQNPHLIARCFGFGLGVTEQEELHGGNGPFY